MNDRLRVCQHSPLSQNPKRGKPCVDVFMPARMTGLYFVKTKNVLYNTLYNVYVIRFEEYLLTFSGPWSNYVTYGDQI
jgi:hypothetical protein